MLKFGKYEITLHNFGFFRLDGGSMFGAVPKNIWDKRIKGDEDNCIPLATRSLLIRGEKRCILVDVGCGEKWNDKSRQIFGIKNFSQKEVGIDPNEVTDVILTHLHFDHAGGISYYKGPGNSGLELTYPKARIHVQSDNFSNAKNPNVREKASYLKDNVEVLTRGDLNLLQGSHEIYPDLWVHQVNGHTRGQQWVEIKNGVTSLMYPTDLIPTSHHLPVPFNMGYDICTETILKEKEAFLSKALETKAIVVFQHDPEIAAVTVGKDERGHYGVLENVSHAF